jgi:hypothetical protein
MRNLFCGACGRDLDVDIKAMKDAMRSDENEEAATVALCACGRYSIVFVDLPDGMHARIRTKLAPEGLGTVLLVARLHPRFAHAAERN